MTKLPSITLPAPLALGVVLGLVDRIEQTHPPMVGQRLRVIQERGGERFSRGLHRLQREAARRGRALISMVPVDLFFREGTVGTVRVVDAARAGLHRWAWLLDQPCLAGAGGADEEAA